jgi:HK97 family phage prohead protease
MIMPVKKEREYRDLAAPLTAQAAAKRIQTDYYVEGYATTFDKPYLLYEFDDGTKIYERIDPHALDGADMSDVIMQYDHCGRVFARQSNKTLILVIDQKGLLVCADLGKTDLAKGLYQDIEQGMINKMSWAFVVEEESYDKTTHTRTILKIKKVYDVSAVSIPANQDTEISARAFASRSYEQEKQELLKRRINILKIKATI